jgi:hypothetical protein
MRNRLFGLVYLHSQATSDHFTNALYWHAVPSVAGSVTYSDTGKVAQDTCPEVSQQSPAWVSPSLKQGC